MILCTSCGVEVSASNHCSVCGAHIDATGPTAGHSSDLPLSSPPKLVRPREGKVFTGVCAALAARFGIPVWLVRLLFIVPGFYMLSGPITYLILSLTLKGWRPTVPASGASRTSSQATSQSRTQVTSGYLLAEARQGALFSAVALFFLHFYFAADNRGMMFASIGYFFFNWVKYIVLGALIGSIVWVVMGLLSAGVVVNDRAGLLIARGFIQGALLVPIGAYSEPFYIQAEASIGAAIVLACLGGGVGFWISRRIPSGSVRI